MFCDIVNMVGETVSGLGILQIPILGNICEAILDFWWGLFDCGITITVL